MTLAAADRALTRVEAMRIISEAVNAPASDPIPNDSIPLFCVSEAVFRKTNREGNDYELASELIAAGADVDTAAGLPLVGAVSFGAGTPLICSARCKTSIMVCIGPARK